MVAEIMTLMKILLNKNQKAKEAKKGKRKEEEGTLFTQK